MKKKHSGLFNKKGGNEGISEHEKQQIINEVQEQMAEEYKTKFDTMKDNIKMMLEQNNQLEA